MNALANGRRARWTVLIAALIAATTLAAAGTSNADRHDGRGGDGRSRQERNDRGYRAGGGGSRWGGGDRSSRSGGQQSQRGSDNRSYNSWRNGGSGGGSSGRNGGGSGGGSNGGNWGNNGGNNGNNGGSYGGGSNGSGNRGYDGGSYRRGGDGRSYGGGAYYRRGGSYGGGSRSYGGGTSYYGGGPVYYGGSLCYQPHIYRVARPRTVVRLGIGVGDPYYAAPPTYVYDTEPAPVVVAPPVVVVPAPTNIDPSTSFDVTNEPPPGCYYYDRFCDQQFPNLDEYTAHVQSHDHANTVEIIEQSSGNPIHTLEFIGGVWRVQH